jgi:hypothetical protein
MGDEDINYRDFTVLEERYFEDFMNSQNLMRFMRRYPYLIVGNYYVMKFKDDYNDPNEEPTVMMVGYFLGIDDRPNHVETLIFSINEGVTLEDYFSMNTHRSRIENGIFQAGFSMEDEFFNMTAYLIMQRRSRRRPVTQRAPSRRRSPTRRISPTRRRSGSRSRSQTRRRSGSRGRTRH